MITLHTAEGPPGARILGLGHYQPANVISNDDLAERIDTSDEWIRERVGIVSRRVANSDESVVDMATTAAGKALAASGIAPTAVDLVVVATCTMPTPIPNAAARVAARLGLPAAAAYDINTACSGFCYGLATADSLIRAGHAHHALVVGAEKLSDWVDWTDRSTCVLFGDGAGAVALGPSDTPGIGPVVWGSDGDKADLIAVPDRDSFLAQNGQPVFRWTTSAIAPLAQQACTRAGVDVSDLAAFVPHQANLRIIESIARGLGIPSEKVGKDIVTAGNTSSASIPIALSRMIERGEIPSGRPALLFGFGAGLTYAGQVVICP